MNRQQRRKLLRQLKKENEQAKRNPLHALVKAQVETRRGSGTDVQLLKRMLLAVEPNPEPILIEYYDFDEKLLKELTSKLRPFICYEQEPDGTISKVIFGGQDFTEHFNKFWESSIGVVLHNAKLKSTQTKILIETIKCLNHTIESLGGSYMDVAHIILSKMPLDERAKQRAEFIDYWTPTYRDLRHLLMFDYGYNKVA